MDHVPAAAALSRRVCPSALEVRREVVWGWMGDPLVIPEMLGRRKIRYFLRLVPGRQYFGMYRFLPFFFLLGGAMEWFMINVRLGEETFYDVYRRKRSERQYEQRMEER